MSRGSVSIHTPPECVSSQLYCSPGGVYRRVPAAEVAGLEREGWRRHPPIDPNRAARMRPVP